MRRLIPTPGLILFSILLLSASGCFFTRGGGEDTDGGSTATDGGGDGGGGGGVEGASAPGTCDDGQDNDGDGFTDCDDFDCDADPVCEAPATQTIYDLRNPQATFHPNVGDSVAVNGVIVTAVDPRTRNGTTTYDVWVEEKAGGPWSAIVLFGVTDALSRGDEIDFRGTLNDYFGLAEVGDVSVTVQATGQALPAPEVLPPATLATSSADAEQWESVLVEVQDVTVIETPVLGSDGKDHGDFRVTGDLIVGDRFSHDYRGMRRQGDVFKSITGVLTFGYDEFRLDPRDNDDLVFQDGSHPGPVGTTIYDIQNESASGHPAADSAVSLSGVVISALGKPDQNGRINFAVQDPSGGQYSGIYVYNRVNADMSTFAVGDQVDLSGTYQEFAFNGDTDTVSEIALSAITKTGTATAPTPEALDVTTLSTAATAEPWEGVLVEIGSATCTAGTNQYGEFEVDGLLKVDDLFMGSDLGTFSTGDTFDRITGVLHYGFGYAIEPRTSADIVVGSQVGPATLAIPSIQDPSAADHPAEGTLVQIVDAVVTAVVPGQSGIKGVTVQQGTGAYSGIYAYVPAAVTLPATPAEGDQVTLTGTYTEYNGLSEITVVSLSVTGTAALPTPEPISDPSIFSGTGAEPWEGVLVKVDKGTTKMVVDGAPDQYGEWTVDGGVMSVDDAIYAHVPAQGDQIQSITGVVDYAFSHFRLWPRSAADITP